MTRRRERLVDLPERWNLGLVWRMIALTLVMLICCLGLSQSTLAIASSASSSEVDAQAEDSGVHRDGHIPPAAQLYALEAETENENENEDATSETFAVESGFGFDRPGPGTAVLGLKRGFAGDSGRVLVSTGLGRGPPVG